MQKLVSTDGRSAVASLPCFPEGCHGERLGRAKGVSEAHRLAAAKLRASPRLCLCAFAFGGVLSDRLAGSPQGIVENTLDLCHVCGHLDEQMQTARLAVELQLLPQRWPVCIRQCVAQDLTQQLVFGRMRLVETLQGQDHFGSFTLCVRFRVLPIRGNCHLANLPRRLGCLGRVGLRNPLQLRLGWVPSLTEEVPLSGSIVKSAVARLRNRKWTLDRGASQRLISAGPRAKIPRRGASLVATALALLPTTCANAEWSTPAQLQGCSSSEQPPVVVFPGSATDVRSGPGALLWSSCGPSPGTFLDPLSEEDLPLSNRRIVAMTGLSAATGTTKGQILLAGSAHRASEELLEGIATGPLSAVGSQAGQIAPMAATSASLGDAAVVSVVHGSDGPVIALQTQRHYLSRPAPPVFLTPSTGAVSALAVNLDFRSDAIIAWVSGGVVYAREVAQTGRAGPLQKIGYDAAYHQLQALISDDGHAMVAWEAQQGGARTGSTTTLRLSISSADTRFGASHVVESFRDPGGVAPAPGSLRLIRLSTEGVVMAWTGLSSARYVVRSAPVSLASGVLAPTTVSNPGQGSMLSDLVGGPHGEALALWTSSTMPSVGGTNARRQILAAVGRRLGHRGMVFDPTESVAPVGPNGPVTAAIDPGDGRALVVWVRSTGHPRVAYAVHAPYPAVASALPTRRGLLGLILGMRVPAPGFAASW